VRAVVRGETEIAITPQAIAMARLGSVAPEVVGLAMSLVNRVLPAPVAEKKGLQRGAEVRGLEVAPVESIGDAAARRYNQT